MAGRFTGGIPSFEKDWTPALGRELTELLRRISGGMNGLQGASDPPTTIQAGATAFLGEVQPAAQTDHVHGVETAAPTVPVRLNGAVAEGSGSSLMRSDAVNVLDDGGALEADSIAYDGAGWQPVGPGFAPSIIASRVFAAERVQQRIPEDGQDILSGLVFSRR